MTFDQWLSFRGESGPTPPAHVGPLPPPVAPFTPAQTVADFLAGCRARALAHPASLGGSGGIVAGHDRDGLLALVSDLLGVVADARQDLDSVAYRRGVADGARRERAAVLALIDNWCRYPQGEALRLVVRGRGAQRDCPVCLGQGFVWMGRSGPVPAPEGAVAGGLFATPSLEGCCVCRCCEVGSLDD